MMNRELRFTPEAAANLKALEKSPAKAGLLRQVRKTLGLLETNLKHPSLNTHSYHSLPGPEGEQVFEAYVQNRTPGAYGVFFYYGPDRVAGKKRVPVLTIVAITPIRNDAERGIRLLTKTRLFCPSEAPSH